MRVLDLHGIKHQRVKKVIDDFIWDCIKSDISQIKIVTGNSSDMKEESCSIIKEYGFSPSKFFNYNSYYIVDLKSI